MPRLEKAHQHFAPEIFRLNGFGVCDLAGLRHRLVFFVAFLECRAV